MPKAIDRGLTATSIFGDFSKIDSDNGYGVMVPFGGEPSVSVGEQPNVYITDRNLHGPEGQWSDITEAGREKIEQQKKVEKKVKEVFNPNFKNNYSSSNNKSNTTPSYTPSFGTSFFQVPYSQRKKWKKK